MDGGLPVFMINPGDAGVLNLYPVLSEQPFDELIFLIAVIVADIDFLDEQRPVGQARKPTRASLKSRCAWVLAGVSITKQGEIFPVLQHQNCRFFLRRPGCAVGPP